MQNPDQMAEQAVKYVEEIAARVYKRYQRLLRANNGVDFDDLLMITERLWRTEPEVLRRVKTDRERLRSGSARPPARRSGWMLQSVFDWMRGRTRDLKSLLQPPTSVYPQFSRDGTTGFRTLRLLYSCALRSFQPGDDQWTHIAQSHPSKQAAPSRTLTSIGCVERRKTIKHMGAKH